MARKTSRSSHSRNRNAKRGGNQATKIIITILAAAAVVGLGFAAYKILSQPDYKFSRADLDSYIEQGPGANLLGDGASVYVDMSDGMNFAYSSQGSKEILQAIINKLAANDAIKFYGLADRKITPLELAHTQLYNYMLNQANYSKQMAPIENALSQIVEAGQPALLMTDFEEYKGGVIEHAAYAKKYFIDWLAKGYNISFYKWAFVEKGKSKNMYLAVFDDNANRLNGLVENAISLTNQSIESYVLGSRDFAYPTMSSYVSLKEGGNYHNAQGKDIVTNVMANGGAEDYFNYCKPVANAKGISGNFAPLDDLYGTHAEYYPIGVRWADAIENAKHMQEEGISPDNLYTHLLSNLYIDFGAQSGYKIDGIEVRTFDVQDVMKAVANGEQADDATAPEVNMFLTASMQSIDLLPAGWKEICVDFDSSFNGAFVGGYPATDLIRANITISRASADISRAIDFFSWPGNPSLADSVKETLTASTSSPVGRVLYTYYLRTLAE